MADFLKSSFLSFSSQKSDKQVSKFLGNKIFKKKQLNQNNTIDNMCNKEISKSLQQQNMTSIAFDMSSQFVDNNESLPEFAVERESQTNNQRFLEQYNINEQEQKNKPICPQQIIQSISPIPIRSESPSIQKSNSPYSPSKSSSPQRIPLKIRNQSRSKTPQRNKSTQNNQIVKNGCAIPVIQIECRKYEKDKQEKPIVIDENSNYQNRNISNNKSLFDPQQIGERLLTLEFELNNKLVKLPVYQDDTAFSLTYKVMKLFKIQSTPVRIEKLTTIIENQINTYIQNLLIETAQWESESRILQQQEKYMSSQQLGELHVHYKGQKVGKIQVLKSQDYQLTVIDFLKSKKIEYNERYVEKLVQQMNNIRRDYVKQFENKKKEIILNKIKLLYFKLNDDLEFENNGKLCFFEAVLQVDKHRIIKINAQRNDNIERIVEKAGIKHKLNRMQMKTIFELLCSQFDQAKLVQHK